MLVGDRGMLTQTQIEKLRAYPGLGWISALRSHAIRDLVKGGFLQMSLFDRKDLAEIHSPDFPSERLMACYNPLLAEREETEAAGVIGGDGEGVEEDCQRSIASDPNPVEEGGDWQEGGQGHGSVQNGEALYGHDWGGDFFL